jgi:hypothetical protein
MVYALEALGWLSLDRPPRQPRLGRAARRPGCDIIDAGRRRFARTVAAEPSHQSLNAVVEPARMALDFGIARQHGAGCERQTRTRRDSPS